MADAHLQRVLILDFGSQYTQLIARRIREIGVYCEIWPWDSHASDIREFAPRGIVLSGGPESVHTDDGPQAPDIVFELNVPVLGICYGMQLMSRHFGGEVIAAGKREYGHAELLSVATPGPLFDGFFVEGKSPVWMSHGDHVEKMPDGFEMIAKTAGGSAVDFARPSERR